MTETIAAPPILEHTIREPPRPVQFPDGITLWKCPDCGGYYPTQEQAGTTIRDRPSRAYADSHRCRSRPIPQSLCERSFVGSDDRIHICDSPLDDDRREHQQPGPHRCAEHNVSERSQSVSHRCGREFLGTDGLQHLCDLTLGINQQHRQPGPHYCTEHNVLEEG